MLEIFTFKLSLDNNFNKALTKSTLATLPSGLKLPSVSVMMFESTTSLISFEAQ